jgi:hypothetical protein
MPNDPDQRGNHYAPENGGGDWPSSIGRGLLPLAALVVCGMLLAFSALAKAGAVCVTLTDNTQALQAEDVSTTVLVYRGQDAGLFIGGLSRIVGGLPARLVESVVVSAHVHASTSVDIRFYGPDGCDLGNPVSMTLAGFQIIAASIGVRV